MIRIAELRKENNLNQTGLAMKLNISQFMISAYESGRNQPSVDILIKMAELFNVSVDYLVGKSDVRKFDSCSYSENEIKCLNYFNRLNPRQQKIALSILSVLNNCEE